MGIHPCLYRLGRGHGQHMDVSCQGIQIWRRDIPAALFLFVIIIGLSGVIGEMSFGRAARSGPMGAFGYAAARRLNNRRLGAAIGCIPVIGSLALAIGYSVIVGWILKYCVGAFTGTALGPDSIDGFSHTFGSMASAFGNNWWQFHLAALGEDPYLFLPYRIDSVSKK